MLEFNVRQFSDDEIDEYREQGYFLYRRLVSGASLAGLQFEADRLWRLSDRNYDSSASWNQNALLNGVHKGSAPIRDLLYRGPLVDGMTQLIGPNVKLASNQLVFKHPRDDRPYNWHQDNGFGPLTPDNAVTCWLALDDTNERNGCLWVIPGSHKGGRVEHHAERGRERVARVTDEEKAVPVIMNAGDCVLFHGDLLHMSKANHTDRVRRACFFRYADADAVEVLTGGPRVGRLLRGVSRHPEVADCSEMVCQPSKNESAADQSAFGRG